MLKFHINENAKLVNHAMKCSNSYHNVRVSPNFVVVWCFQTYTAACFVKVRTETMSDLLHKILNIIRHGSVLLIIPPLTTYYSWSGSRPWIFVEFSTFARYSLYETSQVSLSHCFQIRVPWPLKFWAARVVTNVGGSHWQFTQNAILYTGKIILENSFMYLQFPSYLLNK